MKYSTNATPMNVDMADNLKARLFALLERCPGADDAAMAAVLNVPAWEVSAMLRRMQEEGLIEEAKG